MHRLGTLALVLLAALTLMLAACGDDDDDDEADLTPIAEETDSNGDDSEDDEDDADDDEGDAPIGGTDLEGYFASMEDIATRTDDQLEEIGERLSGAVFETEEEEIDETRVGLQETGEILEVALLEVAELDPPAEVADAHADFLSNLQAFTAVTSDLAVDLDGVTTIQEAESLFAEYQPDLEAADDAFDEACNALQDVADENNIDRDMQCGDD